MGSVTLSEEKVEFEDKATTTLCNVYQHWTGRHVIFVAAFKLQFGSGQAHDIIQKSFLQEIPKDEAKRIAKYETKTDVHDFTERSGRAVKIELHVTISEPSVYPSHCVISRIKLFMGQLR